MFIHIKFYWLIFSQAFFPTVVPKMWKTNYFQPLFLNSFIKMDNHSHPIIMKNVYAKWSSRQCLFLQALKHFAPHGWDSFMVYSEGAMESLNNKDKNTYWIAASFAKQPSYWALNYSRTWWKNILLWMLNIIECSTEEWNWGFTREFCSVFQYFWVISL